jgi:hypothetical protein
VAGPGPAAQSSSHGDNPHALPAAVLPPNFADGYPRYKGANPAPGTVGGKPWFAEVLTDDEWLGDPSKKAREEALKGTPSSSGTVASMTLTPANDPSAGLMSPRLSPTRRDRAQSAAT